MFITKGDLQMNEEKQKNLLGMVCVVLGTVFTLAGLILFIMSNYMNLQMHKAEATIMGMYELEMPSGEIHTMLELTYRVGAEMVLATYEYPGVMDEDALTIDIHYNIKEPGMVMQCEWLFEPLLVSLLGVFVLVPGLYFKGILKFEAFKLNKPDAKASQIEQDSYEVKNTVLGDILPMLAGILFMAFGIIMLTLNGSWWCWIFIIAGGIDVLYVGLEMVPAVVKWYKLANLKKLKSKVKVYDVQVDEKNNTEDKE